MNSVEKIKKKIEFLEEEDEIKEIEIDDNLKDEESKF